MIDDQTVQRLRAVDREPGAELAVERAQRREAVDDDAPVGRPPIGLGATGRLRSEIANDLLDDVLDRRKAFELAVFVDDQTQPLAVGLELLELDEQWRACW